MPNSGLTLLTFLFAGVFASNVQAQQPWSLEAAKIYSAPDIAPVSGAIVIAGTKIQGVVTASQRGSAPAALASQCNGGIAVAGFQNSHVHFTGVEFADARNLPSGALENALTQMLTRYGYTTVVDLASDRDNTIAVRERIEKGDVRGPRILTSGLSLFPSDGLPVYIEHFPKKLLDKFPQPSSAEKALAAVRQNFAAGADALKLFIATPQSDSSIKRMPADIALIAANEAHRQGKLVVAHPTDIRGIEQALAAGVDILAHPPLGAPFPWPEPLMKRVKDAGMSMIPTLFLLPVELEKQRVPPAIGDRLVKESVTGLGQFAAMGGQVLFGTDVGYITEYDPVREYELMGQAGLTSMQILGSLTTSPAERWKEQHRRGRIASGMDADIVVLDADPADSPRNFAAIRCVVRNGQIIYQRQ
jgi:imidazolonepropionase-like amidohydrolase